MTKLSRAAVTALIYLAVCGKADADELEFILGTWTVTTDGRDLGEPVTFAKTLLGYDVTLPFFMGVSSLNASGGEYSSQLKITSGDNVKCFYRLNRLAKTKFTLALRHADSPNCPQSAVFEKISGDNNSAVDEDNVQLDTSFFSSGPAPSDSPKEFSENFVGAWDSIGSEVFFNVKGKLLTEPGELLVYTDAKRTRAYRFDYMTYAYWQNGVAGTSLTEVRNYCTEFPREIENAVSAQFGMLTEMANIGQVENAVKCDDNALTCFYKRSAWEYKFRDGDGARIITRIYSYYNDYPDRRVHTQEQCQITLEIPVGRKK